MTSPFLAAIFALLAAAAWRSGDFTGGLVARRIGPFYSIHISYHVGLLALVLVALARHEQLSAPSDLIWGALAGISGKAGFAFLLRRFSAGRMGIVTKNPSFELKKFLIRRDPDSIHDASLDVAESLAKSFKAELHLLSIIPTLSTLGDEQAAAGDLMPATTHACLDMEIENVKKDLQNHLDTLHEVKLIATAEVARGDPAVLIVKAAGQSGTDMIILSTNRKAGMGAFWACSVAPKVAQKTKTPLLLIPLSQSELRDLSWMQCEQLRYVQVSE